MSAKFPIAFGHEPSYMLVTDLRIDDHIARAPNQIELMASNYCERFPLGRRTESPPFLQR
ncbi:hypothetical protein UB46_02030 [Burkholderiaceae bacterium 16]|nr:hypothetical protein UB46_02030 [Burkholderiaceae bacterium 16]